MNDNKKAIAIVTGASKGIGRAIAIELAKQGHFVIVNYRSDQKGAEHTVSMIKSDGGKAEASCFDVTDNAACQKALDDIFSRFDTVDILVNNAGLARDQLFIMMAESDWNLVLDTALKGFYNMTKPVLKKMVRQKKGAIVSIASVAALIGNRGQANYSAAKAGLIGATRSVASEVARLGIRVNVVAPGLIDTEMIKDLPLKNIKAMIPMARTGKPSEVAKAVKFLCSDDASYITGQVLSVNGGMF